MVCCAQQDGIVLGAAPVLTRQAEQTGWPDYFEPFLILPNRVRLFLLCHGKTLTVITLLSRLKADADP